MSVVGVIAGQAGQADDGIAVDSHQACGGADTTSFLEVSEDRHDLVVGEFGAEEDGPFVLRERLLAGAAAEEAVLALLSEAIVNRKVSGIALSERRTPRVGAAEACEVFHRDEASWVGRRKLSA
jgi:hypothetical protein